MSGTKKYLDNEGVKYLWSRISMEDYPNNETLIAVINAIDESKADKEYVNSYMLNIDYETLLSFNTADIVIGETSLDTTSMLGKAVLGRMILG